MVDRMSNIYWLSGTQMDRLRPYFPKIRGRVRVDDRRVLRGIIFINRNGFRWCDAPSEYGPPKTLYNRWKRWSDMGVVRTDYDGTSTISDATHYDRSPKVFLSAIMLSATVIF